MHEAHSILHPFINIGENALERQKITRERETFAYLKNVVELHGPLTTNPATGERRICLSATVLNSQISKREGREAYSTSLVSFVS